MTLHAEGRCAISAWIEETVWKLQGRTKLAQASITQKYVGELVGVSTWEALLCHLEDGTIRCAGPAHLAGRLQGRLGEFSMEVCGVCKGVELTVVWTIVPDSGRGELRGLSGTGTCTFQRRSSGIFTLNYELA